MKRSVLALTILLSVLCVGCQDLQEAKQHAANAAATVNQLDVKITELQGLMAAAPDGSTLAKYSEKLERYKEERVKWVGILNNLNESIQKAESQYDFLTAGVQAAAPFLGPYAGVAALGTAMLAGYLKTREKEKQAEETKRQAINAIRNIDTVIHDPNLSGGAGKFDATDPATINAMKKLDRDAGVEGLVAEALQ